MDYSKDYNNLPVEDETSNLHFVQSNRLELFIEGEEDDTKLDSAMWYLDPKMGNQCERNFNGGCVFDFGIYFGTSDSRDPKFCPAHYFTGGGLKIKVVAESKVCECKDSIPLTDQERLLNRCAHCHKKIVWVEQFKETK